MLELARVLSPTARTALADLERRTVAADGGRLKLEWAVLTSRTDTDVEDLLWWDGDRLLGFAGIYAFGPPMVEIAGMVDPLARRTGIGTALLDAALPLCRERGYATALLVTPRESEAGAGFAAARGAVLEHSEHALLQLDAPPDGPTDPAVTLRNGAPADIPDLVRILAAAFGDDPATLPDRLNNDIGETLVIERGGAVVGTLRSPLHEGVGSVYGFAVDPGVQGQGIGRDALRRVCLELRARGAEHVTLEVAVENEHALGLYTSLGFERVTTEDYYALTL